MTYNEWRDELKSNLLSVSEKERRCVLDYYAEAYADRRDAGFSEREIIEEFGAPYDAAQRILSENSFDDYGETRSSGQPRESYRGERRERRERYAQESGTQRRTESYSERSERDSGAPPTPPPAAPKQKSDNTWLFVLLCILFAIPIFSVLICMIVFTVVLCVVPFAALISSVATIGAGVGGLFVSVWDGAMSIGTGLVGFGVSLILMPLCFWLVKWMWKLFSMFFAWLKKLFGGKASA